MTAAAFQRQLAELLVTHGTDWRVKNRRGAQPLHYAADANHWGPAAQMDVIAYLLSIGADPDPLDRNGVAPLHRAIRTRSASAVRALLEGGANPTAPNRSGTTPLQLATKTTGRRGTGCLRANEQQTEIIRLLRRWGAAGVVALLRR